MLATSFAFQGLGLLSGALLARLLGVHDRGLLAATIVWPSIIVYLGDLGGPLAYTYLAATRPRIIGSLIANAFALVPVQSIILSLLGIPVILFVLHPYPALIPIALTFLVSYLPLNLLTRYLNSINQGLGRFRNFNYVRLTVQTVYLAGILGLFVLGKNQLVWAVGVILLSNAVALVVALRLMTRTTELKFDASLVRDTFSYGLRGHLGNLTPVDSMQLDLMLVVSALGPRNAGLYAIAVSSSGVVRQQGTALGTVALPNVAAASAGPSRAEAASRIFRLGLLMHVATALIVVLGAGVLIPAVYGTEFAPAVPVVRILVVGMVAASLRQVLGDGLRGYGRPLTGSLIEVGNWLIAVIALAIFVPLLGIVGAALAVSLSYAAALSFAVVATLRLGVSFRQLFWPRWEDVLFAFDIFRQVASLGRGLPRIAASPEDANRSVRL
jgi:O-antigen/teichoic acid export membrane protein